MLEVKGNKVEEFETTFMSNRSKLKQFYKNRKYKVITKEGELVVNASKDLIERSLTAAVGRRGQSVDQACVDFEPS